MKWDETAAVTPYIANLVATGQASRRPGYVRERGRMGPAFDPNRRPQADSFIDVPPSAVPKHGSAAYWCG